MTPNYLYIVRKYRKPHVSTCRGRCTMGKLRGQFFGIPANILLLGKSLNCLYLSQFLTDFHFLKKHLNASVLPQFWSTHLTSSFNFKFFKTGRANSHCAMVTGKINWKSKRSVSLKYSFTMEMGSLQRWPGPLRKYQMGWYLMEVVTGCCIEREEEWKEVFWECGKSKIIAF